MYFPLIFVSLLSVTTALAAEKNTQCLHYSGVYHCHEVGTDYWHREWVIHRTFGQTETYDSSSFFETILADGVKHKMRLIEDKDNGSDHDNFYTATCDANSISVKREKWFLPEANNPAKELFQKYPERKYEYRWSKSPDGTALEQVIQFHSSLNEDGTYSEHRTLHVECLPNYPNFP